MPKVKSFHSIGLHKAYDLEVAHPDHQFYLANGLLTSNSHAVSYAIDSYMCAWLLTHYEPEWLCAYMETQDGQPDKRSEAISELRSFGYEIVRVDINFATDEWTIQPGKKFMPAFSTVKGMGDAAVKEIEENRALLPDGMYKSIEQLLWNPDGSWRHSKFNKRALENLIKICAFDSMGIVGPGKQFESYRHMWRVLIHAHDGPCVDKKNVQTEDPDACAVKKVGGTSELKHKKNGKAELEKRIKELRCPEWSVSQRTKQAKEIVGSGDLNMIIKPNTRKYLESKDLKSIDDYEKPGSYWFILDGIEMKLTKTNKSYALLTIMGLSGKKHRVYCWGFTVRHTRKCDAAHIQDLDEKRVCSCHERQAPANEVYKARLEQSQYGFSTNFGSLFHVKQTNIKETQ